MGFVAIRDEIQIDYMDGDLRTSLWNYLYKGPFGYRDRSSFEVKRTSSLGYLMKDIWTDYYVLEYDLMSYRWSHWEGAIKKRFFSGKWYEVYDLMEFIFDRWAGRSTVENTFIPEVNAILTKELSGYRFVGGLLTPITTEEEISEIEESLEKTKSIDPVRQQILSSIEKLSDRDNPDYRGSIKESISAVETITRIFTGKNKLTLGQALKELEKQGEIPIHPALQQAFIKLYGWTSDDDGIRHALMNDSNLGFEDAKFMLVTCSAFINYLLEKVSRYGIALPEE